MKDYLHSIHPWISFLYFTLVLGFSWALRHPVAQGASLAFGLWYCICCQERRQLLKTLKFMLPLVLLTALVNPLFSHKGATVLFYLPSGNPVTLESVLYGLSSGVVMASVLVWFVSFNRVITSEKFLFLFGRAIPSLSLVLSMTLRFIPRFANQLSAVTDAQRSIGRDVSKGPVLQRMKIAVTILSVMITWALENAIETADSMKSRGYGLPNRSAFSIYGFGERDQGLLAWFSFCGLYLIAGILVGIFDFSYYPSIQFEPFGIWSLSFYLVFSLLCGTPVLLTLLEDRKWKSMHSAM